MMRMDKISVPAIFLAAGTEAEYRLRAPAPYRRLATGWLVSNCGMTCSAKRCIID